MLVPVVMILRVWAMYNRSRLILGVLLTCWGLEIIPSILTCIMYPNKISGAWWLTSYAHPTNEVSVVVSLAARYAVAVTHVSNYTYCGVTSASVTWTKVSAIPEIINSGIICGLVIFQFVKRALEMYRVTKRWRFNRYMNLFAGQSILYFLLCVLSFNCHPPTFLF